VARPGLAVARGADALDNGIHAGVLGTGLLGLALAGAALRFDERGIDGLIAALVGGTRSLGARARTLQSGLVHKELLLAVVGGAVIFVLLTVGSW
jgi:NADH-quinone oxidoreductase subunit L